MSRFVWGLILVLVIAGLIWIRQSGVLQAEAEAWVYGVACAVAGQAAGRILRSLKRDPLPLWLALLVAGAAVVILAAVDEGGLSALAAGLAWCVGLGLSGFPVGFEV